MTGDDRPVVRASEIGQYMFCATSWWLAQVRGVQPEYGQRLQAGARRHAAYERQRLGVAMVRWVGYALCLLAALVGMLLIYSLRGVLFG